MAKLTLTPLGRLQNETTALATISANNAAIVDAMENTLSRDGTIPDQMNANLDMNSFQIINLPVATNPTSPVRLAEVGDAANQASIATAQAAIATTQAGIATTQATNSANSASQAQAYVQGLSGTSSTSNTIGTGSKSFTANTNKLWAAGQLVNISSNANSANYMHGSITSYNSASGALVVNVLDIGGSGTLADWNITVAGSQGPIGATGPSGAVGVTGTPTANQFATWNNSTTLQAVSITGLVKGNGASAPTAATANTDYLTPPSGTAILKANSGGALANAVAGTDYMLPSNNLSDLTNTTTARTNLGLGTAAVKNTGTSGNTVALLDGKNTWTNVQSPAVSALTSSSAADFTTSQVWTANVNGSTFTIANPSSNPPTGSFVSISVTFTTANSLAFGTNFKTTGYTASTSGKDFLTFYWNGTTYELIGFRNATNS